MGSFTKADVRTQVVGNLGDPAKLTEQDIDQHIDEAVLAYSQLSPNVKAYDYTGDGSTYDFTFPSDFVDGFSSLLSIEAPQGEQFPVYLTQTDWIFYRSTTALKLRLLSIPATSVVVRITYTANHIVDSDDSSLSTVPSTDIHAIVYLATSRAALELAGEAVRQAKGGNSDIPFLPGPATDYRFLAQDYLRLYNEFMDVPLDGSKPGLWTSGSLPALPSWDSAPLIREQRNPIPSR